MPQVVSPSTGDSEPLLGILRALGGSDSFTLSFIFGGVVIALYAGKRLGELISPPKDEEYDFTKMLSLSTMVGRDVFYRSYLFYIFLLLFFYFIICSFQPLKDILQGQSTSITFDGSTWPLGAALLVVGVLPTTPVVVQIEQSLRRFAHNMANIPDEFYNRVTALSTQDIETLASESREYDSEVEFFWRATNILVMLGYEFDDATRKARKCVSLRLFGEWTLDRKELWSQSEYQKYRDIVDLLRPKFEALTQQLSNLIVETESSDFISGIASRNSSINLTVRPDLAQMQALQVDAERILNGLPSPPNYTVSATELETFRRLREVWGKIAKECEVAAKRLIALFSIMARNDKRTLRELERPVDAKILTPHGITSEGSRFNDPVLRNFAKLIKSPPPTSEPWYNSIILSSISAFAISFLASTLYRVFSGDLSFATIYDLGQPSGNLYDLVRRSVTISLIDCFFISLSLWFAIVTALFIRSSKIRDQEWLTFYSFKTTPISSYGGVFIFSSIASFPALVLQYIIFYKVSGQEAKAEYMLEVMATNIGVSASFGLFSIGFCIITDIILMDEVRSYFRLCLLLSLPAISLNFIILIVSPGYLDHPIYFINQNLIYIAASLVAIIFYGKGLQSRVNPAVRPPYEGPDRRLNGPKDAPTTS